MKKIMVVLTIMNLIGSTLFSMERETLPTEEARREYLLSLSMLPIEIRKKIVADFLQSEVEGQYELFKQVKLSNHVKLVVLSPDDKTVLITVSNRDPFFSTAYLFDIKTGELKELTRIVHAGTEPAAFSVAFSPDGKTILTGLDKENRARLWDVGTGQEIKQFTVPDSLVTSVAFSPDGKTILIGSLDKKVSLWSVETGQVLQQFIGHTDRIKSVAFSPDGTTVLTSSDDKTARLWSVITGKQLQNFTDFVSSATFSPDGKTVLTASYDNRARLWDVETGKVLQQFSGHTERITSVTFSPDGKRILTGSNDTTARLWDTETGQVLQQFTRHKESITSVAYSPNGKTVLTGALDWTARLWNVETGQQLQKLANVDARILFNSTTFSSNGNLLVLGFLNTQVLIYKLNYTFTPEQKEKAYKMFLEKGLYNIITGPSKEQNKQHKKAK